MPIYVGVLLTKGPFIIIIVENSKNRTKDKQISVSIKLAEMSSFSRQFISRAEDFENIDGNIM